MINPIIDIIPVLYSLSSFLIILFDKNDMINPKIKNNINIIKLFFFNSFKDSGIKSNIDIDNITPDVNDKE